MNTDWYFPVAWNLDGIILPSLLSINLANKKGKKEKKKKKKKGRLEFGFMNKRKNKIIYLFAESYVGTCVEVLFLLGIF